MLLFLQSADTKSLSIEEARENLWQSKWMSFGFKVTFIYDVVL